MRNTVNSMFSFFKRKHSVKVALISREPFKLTLNEWRADETMANAAQKVLNGATVRLILQVLYNSSPAWEVLQGADIVTRAVQQARIEGYTMALANMEAMGIHQKIADPIEATWEPEDDNLTEVQRQR